MEMHVPRCLSSLWPRLSSPAAGCWHRLGDTLLSSRGEQGFLLRVLEGPTEAERNWPELQPSIPTPPQDQGALRAAR